jgi:predicted dehydrogenase
MKAKSNSRGTSRRTFLRRTAVAVAAIGGAPAIYAALGSKSPNERLNLASIGAGGQPFGDLRSAHAGVENVVALADVDWKRGAQGFEAFPNAAKYKDFRQMLDKSGKDIDAVIIGTPDHMHATCALACMQLGKHVYVEKPLTRTPWEARLLTRAAEKYNKVATQMGNQGYSHDATRVACEIIWSGEIGDVHEVHAWSGVPGWPQGMTKLPAPSAVPATLDWDLWLGGAAWREYSEGDDDYRAFIQERSARNRRGPGRGAPPGGPGGAGAPDGSARPGSKDAPAEAPGAPGGAAGSGRRGGGFGGDNYGFYLPFNWRGFYDFGSSLIGDWGVHILGPANWGLQLSPDHLVSVECIKKDSLPPFTFPDELTIKYEFAARQGMPPVTVYWYHHKGGDAYLPQGMSAEEARKIPDTGPQVGPSGGGRGGPRRDGGTASAPSGTAPAAGSGGGARGNGGPGGAGRPEGAAGGPDAGRSPERQRGFGRGGFPGGGSGYNCIFVGSKGYLGTSGRGEGVGLLPGSRWAEYKLPPAYLARSPGATIGDNHGAHCRDWVRASKGGAPACSNFSIAGKYTEWLLLGSVAVHFDGKLLWDPVKGEITNVPEANQWVKPTFRKGWELAL